jgi:hypothetical protein
MTALGHPVSVQICQMAELIVLVTPMPEALCQYEACPSIQGKNP